MELISKEILMSHLSRAEGAEEVTLPIDFFRDLLYQAMPKMRLTQKQINAIPLKNLNSYNTTAAKKYLVRTVETLHGITEEKK